MKKKIGVFGGSGFLGSHEADFLTREKYKVLIYDKVKSDYILNGQDFVQGDIQDKESVNKILKKVDFVYNFSGEADIERSKKNPINTLNSNIILSGFIVMPHLSHLFW